MCTYMCQLTVYGSRVLLYSRVLVYEFDCCHHFIQLWVCFCSHCWESAATMATAAIFVLLLLPWCPVTRSLAAAAFVLLCWPWCLVMSLAAICIIQGRVLEGLISGAFITISCIRKHSSLPEIFLKYKYPLSFVM